MRPASVTGILLLASTFALAGCGGSSPMIETPPTRPVPPATSTLQGQVFGGQQPVTGMTLQLYDAGSAGYGSAATGMLTGTLPPPIPTATSVSRTPLVPIQLIKFIWWAPAAIQ